MKALTLPCPKSFAGLLVLAALLFAGCASSKKIDWASRVGSYTYDQAIAELGPPDKQAKLSDGKTVAAWMTRRSGGMSVGVGTGFSSGYSGVGVGQSISSSGRDNVLNLTFDPDGKLIAWERR